MNNPIVSIITPVYKAVNCIHKCIESIMSQTFTEWEMILVDDGSPDRSGEICDEYALSDSRIKVLHKKNGGPSSARNLGVEHAQGKYIWFVDSDDWIEQGALLRIFNAMNNRNADICFFCLTPISNNKVQPPFDFKSIVSNNKDYVQYSGKQECAEAFVKIEMCGGMGWTCNKWFDRSIIETNHIRFDKRFSIQEDHLFTLSYLLHVKKVLVSNYAPYNYVIAEGSLVSRPPVFQTTKELNIAMYESRHRLCLKYDIIDSEYVKWFTSDFATRIVANLSQLKRTNLTNKERIQEIKEVNSFLGKHKVCLGGICRFYHYINWLPLNLLVKII